MEIYQKIIVLFSIALLTACSSGGTSSEIPLNVTGNFSGTFMNNENTDSGTVQLNLSQTIGSETVTGTFSVQNSTCLENGTISTGTANGFSVNLTVMTGTGTVSLQLSSNNNGTLSGSYFASDPPCNNNIGAGTLTVSL